MSRTINKLNTLAIAQTKKPGLHGDGLGLYLLVSEAGTKSWIFRYRIGSRLRNMGLGAVHTVSLAEAREKARTCRQQRLDGIDPIEVRRAARAQTALESAKIVTFKQCAEAYIAAHQAGWRSAKHAKQWPATLETYAYPVFGSLPVQAIDVGLVMKAIEPLWATKTETASRVRGRIEAVLGWATVRGYRAGDNPARWRGHLENLLPGKSKIAPVEHHAALPYVELAEFMVELRQQDGVGPRALEFAILTAARTGEALGARWSEIDFQARLWVIPAERMKAGREHRVPLSDAALSVLQAMNEVRQGGFIFPGRKTNSPISGIAFFSVLRGMGRGDVTAHGFRSAFSDWCAEQTNFASEVREMALAHAVGNKVEEAYRRGNLFEKRRQLMSAWARFCAAPAIAGEVVAIAGAR